MAMKGADNLRNNSILRFFVIAPSTSSNCSPHTYCTPHTTCLPLTPLRSSSRTMLIQAKCQRITLLSSMTRCGRVHTHRCRRSDTDSRKTARMTATWVVCLLLLQVDPAGLSDGEILVSVLAALVWTWRHTCMSRRMHSVPLAGSAASTDHQPVGSCRDTSCNVAAPSVTLKLGCI